MAVKAMFYLNNLSLIVRLHGLYSIDLDLGGGISSFPLSDISEFDNRIESESHWIYVEGGSCNGLICLYRVTDEVIALLNPSTKEYKILPPVPLSGGYFTFHGILYDTVGDDYMVVTILEICSDPDALPTQLMVYSLKSNMWRRIESFDYDPKLDDPRTRWVLMDGSLHWLACRDSSEWFEIVVSFDPVNEEHRQVQLPQVCDCTHGTLGVLGGCLCVCYTMNVEDAIELWVMNDYMVESSWTKLFRVKLRNFKYNKEHNLQCASVLADSKSSRGIMLLHMFGTLIWYDLKKKRVVNLGISSRVADVIVKSLVKLSHYQ